MKWIVLSEKDGKYTLVSSKSLSGMLPKGSYLTVQEGESKYILRVDNSEQQDLYNPSPLMVDMDLTPLTQDRETKNKITAYRVKDLSKRSDGLVDFIKPLSTARRSTQEEINQALGNFGTGPKVFLATIQYDNNQVLCDENGTYITAVLPDNMFFHQMLISGKTGSGKTVALKYLAQYFVEKLHGAVLAVNVKDVDLLKMDKPSTTSNTLIEEEWKNLDEKPHGINNFIVYYPANTSISSTKDVTENIKQKITLDVKTIDPEALTGLLQNISDIGAMNLPNIFRYWQDERSKNTNSGDFTFANFVRHFSNGVSDGYVYKSLNIRGEESDITLHRGTFDNIQRNLDIALVFFDNVGAKTLDETDILQRGKMSVVDVSGEGGIQFGSILLRHLLHKIVQAKSEQKSNIPVLIIIDEVHMFYNSSSSVETLGDLDTICRTGRSQEIGIIFASQNPQDTPKGLSSVINTKIFFNSDPTHIKQTGLQINSQEVEGLNKGYAVCSIHQVSQLKIVKFPLSLAGVFS
jgi:uncharacterized protein